MTDTTTEYDDAEDPTSNKPLSEAQQEEAPEEPPYVAYAIRDTNLLNHLQLEYIILSALHHHLGSMQVIREYDKTILTIPVNYLQRAKISISIDDSVMCTECKSEIVNPSYNQRIHTDCNYPGRK